jgi:hypothetical protein
MLPCAPLSDWTLAVSVSCCRWRPAGTAEFNKTRNVLIASNAAGVVQHW